jgi:uncharacterized membrane protein (GlpM family)
VTADVFEVLAKAVLGGLLVVIFAVFAETLSPKRFAGVFAAAPSVALASLSVTVLSSGPLDARRACAGMTAGAVGFIGYCLLAPVVMRRWGSLRGSGAALAGWFIATAAALPLAAATLGAKSAVAAGARGPRPGARQRPELRCEPGKVREAKPKDWLIRFLFGAATSAIAGILSTLAGPFLGGTFLAFPAILLASLTLVSQEEGAARARDDARGATAGALGLFTFAALGATVFHRLPTAAVFAATCAVWAVVALGAYAIAWLTGAGADEPD